MRDPGPHIIIRPRLRAGDPAWTDPGNKAGLVANYEFFGAATTVQYEARLYWFEIKYQEAPTAPVTGYTFGYIVF